MPRRPFPRINVPFAGGALQLDDSTVLVRRPRPVFLSPGQMAGCIHPAVVFKIEADQAIALLEILVDEEVTDQVSEQAAQVDPDSKKASDKLRRPNFNFTQMDIPTGAELVFARGGEHK